MEESKQPLWRPAHAQESTLYAFSRAAEAKSGTAFPDYDSLWRWSVSSPEAFWGLVWERLGVIGERGGRTLVEGSRMPGARWFPDARLNFAENLLRDSANEEALVFWGEDKVKRRLSRSELRRQVARMAAALRAQGVGSGDRVAAYLPNLPETVIAMLASAALGAVFTSTSPDFGVQGVLDRFGQTRPKVLIACDGYWYNGKPVDLGERLAQICRALPGLQRVVIVPYLETALDAATIGPGKGVMLDDFLGLYEGVESIEYAHLPFDHPLYIMYSSGTTGAPKCIVHGAGGTLLQHLKEHRLHSDIREHDQLFYFTTCGWMMWNWLASGLASGATLLLYDGNPMVGDGNILWEFAAQERITHFGTSAKYLDLIAKSGLHPGSRYDLSALRVLLSTGSPLAPEGFDYVYREVKSDLQLSSISGGTDIISCFVLGNPLLPVWPGEIQCRGLGMAVEVWDEQGRAIERGKGELVCTRPFPSMPIGFWNDPDGAKYRAAYFERFDNVWCHGDYCEITEHGGLVIHGRSDATLNPGGVRIGTAEIYRQVERLSEVVESVVIGQAWQGDLRVVLFVRLRQGLELTPELAERIRRTIRDNTTPRHVPAKILQVSDIPRTKSGKIVELAVRNVVHGRAVTNMEALDNPQALDQFRDLPELSC